MLGITRLLANEWAAKGINVNAIAPGYIETNNTEALRADPDRSAAILGAHPGRPLGRAGRHRRRRRVPAGAGVRLHAWRGDRRSTAAGWRDEEADDDRHQDCLRGPARAPGRRPRTATAAAFSCTPTKLMTVEFTFEKGGVGALHSHPHVQASYIAEGRSR